MALSAMVNAAERLPLAEGVNNMAIVQVPPAATEELQVLAWPKSEALAPANAMLVMLSVVVPVLVSVTVCDALFMSTG